jgi:hypothetical protein
MTSGFYSIAYTGAVGTGFGLLAISKGVIAGVDVAGSTYDGTYVERSSLLDLKLTMRMPVGTIPVQTGVPLTEAIDIPLELSLPNDFGAGKPLLVQMPIGPVNVIFKKVRDFPRM